MVRKTIVTQKAETLVAYHTLKSGSDIITKRLQRQLSPLAEDVYNRLQKRQKINDGTITATYRFENKDKARTLSEGINEFSQRHPKYGKILKNIIAQTRKTKQRYLCFGQKDDLPQEVYTQVFESIKIPEHMQQGLIENIRKVSEQFSKKRSDGLCEMLIK